MSCNYIHTGYTYCPALSCILILSSSLVSKVLQVSINLALMMYCLHKFYISLKIGILFNQL